jgi:hypothetical protein
MLSQISTGDAASRMTSMALPRWYTNGRAGLAKLPGLRAKKTKLGNEVQIEAAEFVQLRVRVIALENLVITLLAEASDRQRNLAREMAVFIAPRTGTTPHPLTTHAASHMVDLVERSEQFRSKPAV